MENKRKKVGILTLPLSTNYGGVLQAYALQNHLKSLNYDAWLINRRWNNERKDISYKIQKWIYNNIVSYHFTAFVNENINPKTNPITSFENMEQINKENFDAVIVGSDQVWRTEHTTGVGLNYFLDFIKEDKVKRIAYAASFGTDNTTSDEQEMKEINKLLNKFNAISVREDSGLEILNTEFEISGLLVIDPTLLLNKEQYFNLIKPKDDVKKKDLLTTYVLDNRPEVEEIISKIAETKKLNISAVNAALGKHTVKNLLLNINKNILPSISKWISGFKNADFIVTDSFHGTIFSILFNKPFICIGNKERGLARFESLLRMFRLEDRLILSIDDLSDELINSEIDYNEVNKILVTKREVATKFLIDNI